MKSSAGRRMMGTVAAAAIAGFLCMGAASDDPAERLANPVQEARARQLFQQLRCVVCQNESIDDSQAEIAGDLRRIVRSQITAGRSDQQVRDFLVQRYGEFILLKPTLTLGNAALWGAPFLLIVLGAGYLWTKSRDTAVETGILTEEEQSALDAIASDDLDMLSPHNSPTKAHGTIAIKH